jgi:hypothetical protein
VVSSVSDALERLQGADFGLPKTLLRALHIPLRSLDNVALRDIEKIEFLTNRVPAGSVFLSDLALVKTSIGTSRPIHLPRLSVNSLTIEEGDSGNRTMRFRVTLSRPATRKVRVHVDAANDFFFGPEVVAPVSRELVFLPGQTARNVAVTVRGNTLDGFDRVFPVVLSIPTESILANSIGIGTVLDDDPTPTVQIGPGSANESAGLMSFPLTLSAPTGEGIFVEAELLSGTATVGSDLGPDPFAFGFIEPGVTTGELVVPILDDGDDEPNETFTVNVLAAFGADLAGPASVTGTIIDDD